MKTVLVVLAVLAMTLGASAQSPYSDPVLTFGQMEGPIYRSLHGEPCGPSPTFKFSPTDADGNGLLRYVVQETPAVGDTNPAGYQKVVEVITGLVRLLRCEDCTAPKAWDRGHTVEIAISTQQKELSPCLKKMKFAK
jgi:hypothetical protein